MTLTSKMLDEMALRAKSLRAVKPYDGLRIIEDASLTDPYEDWSAVRSPSRARRRMRKGHRQNVVIRQRPKRIVYRVGDTLVMHPAMAAALRSAIPGPRAPKSS